jgi:hypothetical protein
MSHFTVLVIGNEPEKQLSPYQENNMGDCPSEYLEFIEDEDCGLDSDNGKHGYWENTNRKWDWYLLGGRWTGFFKLKSGLIGRTGEPGIMTDKPNLGFADQAFKSEIDFDGMILKAVDEANKRYEDAMTILSPLPVNESWKSVRERIKDVSEARDFYNSQERCKTKLWDVDQFLIPKDEFVKLAKENALSTFAIIKDGIWYEKGTMGWFAFVSNEKPQTDWNNQFNEILQGLPDNTLLSLYDCHI